MLKKYQEKIILDIIKVIETFEKEGFTLNCRNKKATADAFYKIYSNQLEGVGREITVDQKAAAVESHEKAGLLIQKYASDPHFSKTFFSKGTQTWMYIKKRAEFPNFYRLYLNVKPQYVNSVVAHLLSVFFVDSTYFDQLKILQPEVIAQRPEMCLRSDMIVVYFGSNKKILEDVELREYIQKVILNLGRNVRSYFRTRIPSFTQPVQGLVGAGLAAEPTAEAHDFAKKEGYTTRKFISFGELVSISIAEALCAFMEQNGRMPTSSKELFIVAEKALEVLEKVFEHEFEFGI